MPAVDRRSFLALAGLTAGLAAPASSTAQVLAATGGADWTAVRAAFQLSPQYVHLNAMLFAAHPKGVRDTIDFHRRMLDAHPVTYLEDNNRRLQQEARAALGRYLGVGADQIALTGSTTESVALVYNGLKLRPGDEVLTTDQDYYVTHESLRHASAKNRSLVRRISLYDDIAACTDDQMVERVMAAITPRTRVVALTWVHSSTGLKIPSRRIAERIAALNAGRPEAERVLYALDGVHGFGIENETLESLGCDIFMAGCHKWLFGPRGTGLVAANEAGWRALTPTVPSFIDSRAWSGWISGDGYSGEMSGSLMSPGGFKAFEHVWALPRAVEFHERLGKAAVATRTHALAGRLKQGLAAMPGVSLKTPMSPAMSAGIVSFDVAGRTAGDVVLELRRRTVIASAAPYAVQHVRLTPSIYNAEADIDRALAAVREIAGA